MDTDADGTSGIYLERGDVVVSRDSKRRFEEAIRDLSVRPCAIGPGVTSTSCRTHRSSGTSTMDVDYERTVAMGHSLYVCEQT